MRKAPAVLWRVTFADGTADVIVRDVIKREWRSAVNDSRLLTDSLCRFLPNGYGGQHMDPDGRVWRSRADIAKQVRMSERNVQANTAKARHIGFLRCIQVGRKVGRAEKVGQSSIYQACVPVRASDVDDIDALPVWPCPAVIRPKQALQGDVQGDAGPPGTAIPRETQGDSLHISLDISPVVRTTTGATGAAFRRSSTPRPSAAVSAPVLGGHRPESGAASARQRNRSDDAAYLRRLPVAIRDGLLRRAHAKHQREGLEMTPEAIEATAVAIQRQETHA